MSVIRAFSSGNASTVRVGQLLANFLSPSMCENRVCVVQVPVTCSSQRPCILSMAGTQMLVATDSCEIYEILDSDGTNLHRGPMVQGHYGHGVRGLAVHPTNPDQFASAGADRTVRVWSRSERKMVSPLVKNVCIQVQVLSERIYFFASITAPAKLKVQRSISVCDMAALEVHIFTSTTALRPLIDSGEDVCP